MKAPNFSDPKIPHDLMVAAALVYEPNGLECSVPIMDRESAEYGACTFELNGSVVQFRVSKITPKKVGQFVTVWKRIGNGPIQPFDLSDPVDFFIVSCRNDRSCGQFVFPKSVLCQRDIVSRNGKGGKRGIRVYPAWDKPTNRQALHTQKWQLDYFLEMSEDRPVDQARARALYGLGVA